MKLRNLLLGTLLVGSLGGLAAPAMADVDVYLNYGPPPLRVERVPAPRTGYVWVPGYWDWRGRNYVWINGTWLKDRPGYYYQSHRWIERDGRWYRERGGWHNQRDRDRDGIPDRYDSRPRDRDNDGVPDRRDNHPDNPRRN